MESNPPPLPRGRSWWRHWLVKTFVGATLTIVLCVVAFYVIERELGERAWRKYQAEAAAKGVKFYVRDYAKAPIPDEENYAAAPIFQKLFADRASTRKVQGQFELPTVPKRKPGEPTLKRFDLAAWQKAFARSRWIPSQGSDSAADVLAALQRLDPPLSEVRQASQRPKCRWPVKWEEDFAAESPHLSVLQNASTAFALRATALLEQGKPEAAMAELRQVIRAADSLKGEPTLLPPIVRAALWSLVFDCAEQGLASNQWNDEQLRELLSEIAKAKFMEELAFSLTSERGTANLRFDKLTAMPRSEFAKSVSSLTYSDSAQVNWFWYCLPRGLLRRNQVVFNQLIDLDVEDIDAKSGRIDPRFPRSGKVLTAKRSSVGGRFTHWFAILALPVNEGAVYRAAAVHTRAEQLRVLISAIQYRAKHNELPPTLDSLMPEFLAEVPTDPMDGKPLRYRRTDEGGFLIWSIGKNRIDDGGKIGFEPSPSKALDWVTELPPLRQ